MLQICLEVDALMHGEESLNGQRLFKDHKRNV